MTNVTKLALLGVGVPAAAGSTYLIYHMSKPGTFLSKLALDGKEAIAPGEAQKWKSKFIDFSENIKSSVADSGYTSGDVTDAQANKLRDWCQKESEKSSTGDGYETYSQLCSTDIKTVRAKLISEGLEIPSGDNDWQLIFLNHKHNSNFIDRFQTSGQIDLSSSTTKEVAGPKVKSKCESWFAQNLGTNDGYQDAQGWCVKSKVDTVEKRFETISGFRKLSGDEYGAAHGNWKTHSTYKSDIGITAGDGDKSNLKTYCEEKYSTSLINLSNYDEDLKKVFNYCNGSSKDSSPATLKEITWQT